MQWKRSLSFNFKGLLSVLRQLDNFWYSEALWKWWKMFFISSQNFFAFLRYINFCPGICGHVGKQLDKKAVNFKIYDVRNRETNN